VSFPSASNGGTVPGYKALSHQFSGSAAEHVRYAEVLQRAGDPEEAVLLLEDTLEAYVRTVPELPGWLCGRLASLYRSLKRYDDEVLLLERYRESQSSEEARTRFDARLSKARAIADRKQRQDTNVLESVRRVINGRGVAAHARTVVEHDDDRFSCQIAEELRTGLRSAAVRESSAGLERALVTLRAEAFEQQIEPERVVSYVKRIWHTTSRPDAVNREEWESIYRMALTRSLMLYFGVE
jgi:hypothetical protein